MRRLPLVGLLALLALEPACRHATAPDAPVPTLSYEEGPTAERHPQFWSSAGSTYLTALRVDYRLDDVVAGATTDLERVRAVSRWTHERFAHDGSHAAPRDDPRSILVAAATGQRFRCVEYAAVTSGALTALGIPTRMLWLLTRDEGTRSDGIAHVVAEAYLRDAGRWVMVDAQWDAVPTRDGAPLSAVALQQALATGGAGVAITSRSGTRTPDYLRWITPYLHFYYTPLDHRIGEPRSTSSPLLLTPVGDASLLGKYPVPWARYTHAPAAFYAAP